jgi:hypothetical protein
VNERGRADGGEREIVVGVSIKRSQSSILMYY